MSEFTRPRARDLGIPFGGTPGPFNAITDTPGVTVGHHTLNEGHVTGSRGQGPIRTGVTVIHPLGADSLRAVTAARTVINGTGEWTGMHFVDELGEFHGPIALTGTGNLAVVHSALSRWGLTRDGLSEDDLFMRLLPVVGETLDFQLNDVFRRAITEEQVIVALESATTGAVVEGNVGGGTGMVAYEFKGGIGTSSRVVRVPGIPDTTMGVLLQANHGRRSDLVVAGIPVGTEITDLMPTAASQQAASFSTDVANRKSSLLIVVATDAPLLPHQLSRLAKRACFGVGRCGSTANAMSGEFVLAFSTCDAKTIAGRRHSEMPEPTSEWMNALFAGVAQAVEESLVNQLVASETMQGIDGRVVHALPHERMVELLHRFGRYASRP